MTPRLKLTFRFNFKAVRSMDYQTFRQVIEDLAKHLDAKVISTSEHSGDVLVQINRTALNSEGAD